MENQDRSLIAPPVDYSRLLSAFKPIDLLFVLNNCSLRFNPSVTDFIVRAIIELNPPTIHHHHDLLEMREFEYHRSVELKRPGRAEATSNFLLESPLQQSLTAHVLETGFEVTAAPLPRESIRATLGHHADSGLAAQTTSLDVQNNVHDRPWKTRRSGWH
jgi:hypothetical protein